MKAWLAVLAAANDDDSRCIRIHGSSTTACPRAVISFTCDTSEYVLISRRRWSRMPTSRRSARPSLQDDGWQESDEDDDAGEEQLDLDSVVLENGSWSLEFKFD